MLYPVACYIILFKAVRVWWTLVLLDFSFGWLFSNLFDTYPFYHGLIMWQEFQVNCSLVDINGKILAGKHGMTRFALFAWTWLKFLGMNPWWNSSRKNLHQTYTRRFSIFFWKFCMKSPKPAPNIPKPPSWTEVFQPLFFLCWRQRWRRAIRCLCHGAEWRPWPTWDVWMKAPWRGRWLRD